MEQLMRSRILSEEQIAQLLKDYENDLGIYKICRKYDISGTTFYRLKKENKGFLSKADARRRDKNYNLLKKKLELQEQEIRALKAALRKKF